MHSNQRIPGVFSLLLLSGHDEADFDSPEEVFKIVVRERGLNNVPGNEWIYSSTNYSLLGMVVKGATQQSLSEFAVEKTFQPLGRSHTLFYDNHTLVVPGRVDRARFKPAGQLSRGLVLRRFELVGPVVSGAPLMTCFCGTGTFAKIVLAKERS